MTDELQTGRQLRLRDKRTSINPSATSAPRSAPQSHKYILTADISELRSRP